MRSLAPILELLQISRSCFVAMAESAPENLWRKSPDADTWSPAEVVAHETMVEQFIIARSRRRRGETPRWCNHCL